MIPCRFESRLVGVGRGLKCDRSAGATCQSPERIIMYPYVGHFV